MNIRDSLSAMALTTALSTFSLVTHAEQLQDITLQFAGELGGQPADCSASYEKIGVTQATVGMSDYRLYVSNIRLLDAGGNQTPLVLSNHGPWQHDDIALLDFENGTGRCTNGTAPTNNVIKGQVPVGEYQGVVFDIGVPLHSNHQDPTLAASPLNLTALFWNWRGGYRFLRVDLLPQGRMMTTETSAKNGNGEGRQPMGMQQGGGGHKAHKMNAAEGKQGKPGWALHLGSTGCLADSPTQSPESCQAPNRVNVNFPLADPETTVFVIDPAAVLAEADVTRNTLGTSPGCMSAPDDPECETVLKALGLSKDNADQLLVTVR